MSYDCFCDWVNDAKNPSEIEYLIGLDNNEPEKLLYENKFQEANKKVGNFLIDMGNSTSAIQAVNRLATKISDTSELLIEVCDDIGSFSGWDTALFETLKGIDNFKDPKMIGTHDGLRDYGVVFTQPIMNRACYNKLGYIIYIEYTSMFADNDFTEIARRTGWLINAPHILFRHKHYSIGFNKMDATYSKRNNTEEWDYNRQVYLKREKENFGL
jgi:hypothetical protein